MELISLNLRGKIELDKEDPSICLISCETIDSFSYANSIDKAIGYIKEVIELWFESCLRRGVLIEALEEVGIIDREEIERLKGSFSNRSLVGFIVRKVEVLEVEKKEEIGVGEVVDWIGYIEIIGIG